jgi:uncharacterized protein (DUF433 family)
MISLGENREIYADYSDPQQMGDVPCVRGLRIPVATVVGMVADQITDEKIIPAFPDLVAGSRRREDFRAGQR